MYTVLLELNYYGIFYWDLSAEYHIFSLQLCLFQLCIYVAFIQILKVVISGVWEEKMTKIITSSSRMHVIYHNCYNQLTVSYNRRSKHYSIDLLFCADILCPMDVHETWSTLLVFMLLASSAVYSLEIKVPSVSQVTMPRSEKLAIFSC